MNAEQHKVDSNLDPIPRSHHRLPIRPIQWRSPGSPWPGISLPLQSLFINYNKVFIENFENKAVYLVHV